MIKRIYAVSAFVAVLVILTILASCGPEMIQDEQPTPKPESAFVIFPIDDQGGRWSLYDKPGLEAQFARAGLSSCFVYSSNNVQTEYSHVQTAIAEGYDILIIVVADSEESLAAVESAKNEGLFVILYDRVVSGYTTADCYVSYDNLAIGNMQGKFLVDAVAEESVKTNIPLYIYAGHGSDENAKLFFSGVLAELQPKIDDGTFTIINSEKALSYKDNLVLSNEQITEIVEEVNTQWDPAVAETMAIADIAEFAPLGHVHILAPNDATSRSIAAMFRDNGNTIVITGQDGETASLQAILDGKQSMTLLKPFGFLADALEPVFSDPIAGETPVLTKTFNNGTVTIPFASTMPRLISTRVDIEACIEQDLIDGDSLVFD